MAELLTQAWIDRLVERGATLPEIPGASATVQHVITGAPEGEIRYHQTIVDGRVQSAGLGDLDGVDLTLTVPYDQALAAARGETLTPVELMRGRAKQVGSSGHLMALMPLLMSDGYREAVAAEG
jgi:hypothetical protein